MKIRPGMSARETVKKKSPYLGAPTHGHMHTGFDSDYYLKHHLLLAINSGTFALTLQNHSNMQFINFNEPDCDQDDGKCEGCTCGK